jgi:hypothetical protein
MDNMTLRSRFFGAWHREEQQESPLIGVPPRPGPWPLIRPRGRASRSKGRSTRPNQMRKKCVWTYDMVLCSHFIIKWYQV